MNTSKSAGCILLALFVVVSTGCGTFFYNAGDRIEIKTNPPGASIYIDGDDTERKTPFEGYVRHSNKGRVITIKKEGYKDAVVALNCSNNITMVILDILFTAGLGLFIDSWTGGLYEFDEPKSFEIVLQPDSPAK